MATSQSICAPERNPGTETETLQYFKILAGRKAPAAATKKNENVNNMICHHYRQYSLGRRSLRPL